MGDDLLRVCDRWWHDIWAEGDLDATGEIFADPFVRHTAVGTATTSTAEYRQMLAEFQRTLCRAVTTIDDRAVSGDRVWTRATSRGFNRDTGEPVVLTWLLVQRVVDGRIVEHWVCTLPGVEW